jgi:hypothetical protein
MPLPESPLATAALFILAGAVAVGGLTAYVRLAEKNTPVDVGLLHGGAGLTAALLLLVSLFRDNTANPNTAPTLGFLALTILAGITLYYLIRRRGLLPKTLVLIHALLAVSAVHTLLRGWPT